MRRKRKSRGFQDRKAKVRLGLLGAHPYCHWCNAQLCWETATLDHRVPRSRGGDNSAGNLVLACQGCNRTKGDMMPEEFLSAVAGGKIVIGGTPIPIPRHPLCRPATAGVAT